MHKPVKLVTARGCCGRSHRSGCNFPGLTGWGLTDLSPEVLPYTLQKVQLSDTFLLWQAATVWSKIPDNVIMAGFRDGTRDACNATARGPLSFVVRRIPAGMNNKLGE
jgi:hypothetical protein